MSRLKRSCDSGIDSYFWHITSKLHRHWGFSCDTFQGYMRGSMHCSIGEMSEIGRGMLHGYCSKFLKGSLCSRQKWVTKIHYQTDEQRDGCAASCANFHTPPSVILPLSDLNLISWIYYLSQRLFDFCRGFAFNTVFERVFWD